MDFTIYDIVRFYWARKYLLLAVISAIFILMLTYFVLSPKQYQAALEVLPADMRQDGISSSAGGALAQALIGGGTSNPDFANFTASLSSIQLAEHMLANARIAQTAFSYRWDKENNRWVSASASFTLNPKTLAGRGLRFLFDRKAPEKPTAFEMRDFIQGQVTLMKNSENRSTRLLFKHTDPSFARFFLENVVRELDDILRRQRLSSYEKENAALRERFAAEGNKSVQEYMIKWISENESRIVKTKSAEYFAFQVLDPISVTSDPVSPRPLLSVIISIIVAVLGGFFLTGSFGLVRFFARTLAKP